jgi:hypothetical protein
VQLIGTTSNWSAIGARTTVRYGARQQSQELLAQSSYSANDPRLQFGLGAETLADLTIRWPRRSVEKITRVKANQLIIVREGKGLVRALPFEPASRGRRLRVGIMSGGRHRRYAWC